MSESFRGVVDIIERLWHCESLQAVFDITDAYGKSLGYQITTIVSCGRMMVGAGETPPFLTNVDPEWLERYVEKDYFSKDPVVQRAARSCCPFTYTDAYSDASAEVKKFKMEAAAYGIIFGWAVPVHRDAKAPGVVSFCGPNTVTLDAAAQLRVSMVGMIAYQRASEFFADMIPQLAITLSDRERAVLMLVARGKTNWEVGAVLSISEYSVRDYLKALSVKLETSNRTHTVARAMQLGLIVP